MRKQRSEGDKPPEKRPPNVSRMGLEGAALRYLERFDCSVERLRKVLMERVAKAARLGAPGRRKRRQSSSSCSRAIRGPG